VTFSSAWATSFTPDLRRTARSVHAAHVAGVEGPSIARGVGMAIGLFCLTILSSICQHQASRAASLTIDPHNRSYRSPNRAIQFFFRSMCIGVLSRAALICATYKRAMNFTLKSRALHPWVTPMTASALIFIHLCALETPVTGAERSCHT
jgi:hypothetical protein